MTNLRDRLRRLPLPLILALAVAVGATVVMVLQITVLPPPPAIVAPADTQATALTSGSQTVTFAITAYAGQTVTYDNIAAFGRVSLQANTTGWYYQANDFIYTVMRRSTGNATFTLPTGVTVDVFQYNSTHALVVNRQRNTAVITRIVSVGTTGWYAYHPVTTVYDTATRNGINRYLTYRSLTQINIFLPRGDYIVFDASTKVFRVYFDVATSSGITAQGTSLTNSTSFTALPSGSAVVPTNYFIIDVNNVVLPPVWVIYRSNPTSSVSSALTIAPQSLP
jgi:hypothetical protein